MSVNSLINFRQLFYRRTNVSGQLLAIALLLPAAMSAGLVHAQTSSNTMADPAVQLQSLSADALEQRISQWYQRSRPDRMEPLLAQLLRVHPEHPLIYEAQAAVALQREDFQQAEQLYRQLQAAHPEHAATERLAATIRLNGAQQSKVGEARLLGLAGRYDEALQLWQDIFPEPPAHPDLGVEYWQAVAFTEADEQALAGLQRLQRRYPNHRRLELAIIRQQLRMDSLQAPQLTRLTELTQDPVVGNEAIGIWRRALDSLPVTLESLAQVRELRRLVPDDQELAAGERRLIEAYETAQRLATDPNYQQQQQALALLNEGQPAQALSLLEQVMPARAADAEAVGAMGYAHLQLGNAARAVEYFQQANNLTPSDEWQSMVEVATFWSLVQRFDRADEDQDVTTMEASFRRLNQHPEADNQAPLVQLREARLLIAQQRYEQALPLLDRLLLDDPTNESVLWTYYAALRAHESERAVGRWLAELSLPQQQVLQSEIDRLAAQQLIAAGDELLEQSPDQAQAKWLQALPLTPDDPWLIARLAQLDNPARAEQRFHALISRNPSDDAYFAFSLWQARQGQLNAALNTLAQVPTAEQSTAMVSHQQQVQQRLLTEQLTANWSDLLRQDPAAWLQLEGYQVASILSTMADQATANDQDLLPTIEQQLVRSDLTQEDRVGLYADASRFADAVGSNQQAYQWSVTALRLQQGDDSNDVDLWLNASSADWRTGSLQRRARQLLQQDQRTLTIAFERQSSNGTNGISTNRNDNLLLEYQAPWRFTEHVGRWYVRADTTRMDAKRFDADNDFWRNRFGTGLLCQQDCPSGLQPSTSQQGVALAFGASFEQWEFDLGTSPLGFQTQRLLGSVSRSGALGEFGWRLSAHQRLVTNNLISAAGQTDLYDSTPADWGGVIRRGFNGSLSWDQGQRFGWWSNLGQEYYRGDQVADNQRWYAYTGGYWRLYDTERLAISAGITALAWGFDQDLSGFTLGHGGYYSPQLYQSLSLPVTLFGRFERWSYSLRAAIGRSQSRFEANDFFPNNPALQRQAEQLEASTGITPVYAASRGEGSSSSLSAVVEYKINAAWYLGFATDIRRAQSYAPNQGQIYLRYNFAGSDLPPNRPPTPLPRYIDF